jgi:hypothetical protein
LISWLAMVAMITLLTPSRLISWLAMVAMITLLTPSRLISWLAMVAMITLLTPSRLISCTRTRPLVVVAQYRALKRFSDQRNQTATEYFTEDVYNDAITRGAVLFAVMTAAMCLMCVVNCVLCYDYASPVVQAAAGRRFTVFVSSTTTIGDDNIGGSARNGTKGSTGGKLPEPVITYLRTSFAEEEEEEQDATAQDEARAGTESDADKPLNPAPEEQETAQFSAVAPFTLSPSGSIIRRSVTYREAVETSASDASEGNDVPDPTDVTVASNVEQGKRNSSNTTSVSDSSVGVDAPDPTDVTVASNVEQGKRNPSNTTSVSDSSVGVDAPGPTDVTVASNAEQGKRNPSNATSVSDSSVGVDAPDPNDVTVVSNVEQGKRNPSNTTSVSDSSVGATVSTTSRSETEGTTEEKPAVTTEPGKVRVNAPVVMLVVDDQGKRTVVLRKGSEAAPATFPGVKPPTCLCCGRLCCGGSHPAERGRCVPTTISSKMRARCIWVYVALLCVTLVCYSILVRMDFLLDSAVQEAPKLVEDVARLLNPNLVDAVGKL